MTRAVGLVILAASAAAAPMLRAQSDAPGVTPAWELKKRIAALVEQANRLSPLIDEVKPQTWPADAPVASYREQQLSAKREIGYLAQSATSLARDPEKMPIALDAFLRLSALERMLDSLSEGVRRYQNPALADLMQGMISENSTHRNRLQTYLIELIATKQDELRIANDEAQACRGALLKTPVRVARPVTAAPAKPPAPSPPPPRQSQPPQP